MNAMDNPISYTTPVSTPSTSTASVTGGSELRDEKASPSPTKTSSGTATVYGSRTDAGSSVKLEKGGDGDSQVFALPNLFVANGLFYDSKVDSHMLDVSNFSDDGRAWSLTLRSFVVGSVVACFGAAIYQVYVLKPVLAAVSSTFLVTVVYILGVSWAYILPQPAPLDQNTSPGTLSCFVARINPGPFSLKEHAVASIIALSGANGSLAVQTLCTQHLYYKTKLDFLSSFLAIFSTACFGCGVAGLFYHRTSQRPQSVYPNAVLNVSTIRAFHNGSDTRKPLILFSAAFFGMLAYETLPAYVFPLLNGVNIFCLASQKAPKLTIDAFTSLFGGASGNEGLGLFSVSFDWQFIGSSFMHLPISYQVNIWFGFALCYATVMGIYYSNIWNSWNIPILSTTIFHSNGTLYDQTRMLDEYFRVIPAAVESEGLPYLTGSFLWANMSSNLAVGSLVAHALCVMGPKALYPFYCTNKDRKLSPQRRFEEGLPEVPLWWYAVLIFLAFFAGLAVVLNQHEYLSEVSYIIALVVGAAAVPFAITLSAYLGHWVLPTPHMAKMVGSVVAYGRPLGIIYFAMWSESAVASALHFADQLKLAEYTKVSPKVAFYSQIWGLLLGGVVNHAVMLCIVENQGETFLSALGTNIWNGQVPQILNSEAVTWSLANDLYNIKAPYFIVPLCLLIGAVLGFLQFALHLCWPRLSFCNPSNLMLPVIFMYSSLMTFGITSSILSSILVGILSQLWLRHRHWSWFNNQSMLVGSAFDGGAQSMLLLLSFTVLGGMGSPKPFLQWAGNSIRGNVDYCNGNGALD
ncbi:oligopeptide transporter [Coprinopsis marcescibilis]|uniref:Oligopeptide transporter n=1 Tax=Coprinopsis marcescibilis TaxID=230819 RepID=A0A5C3LDR1_COPMA|nr:oligopeptide transporter [Coprinopsis marcescibilis]